MACWCARPSHSAEVQCSICRKNIHYECLGISITELSILINQDPGLYVCKLCTPLAKKARDNLLKTHSGNTLFEFDTKCYDFSTNPCKTTLSSLDKAIETHLNQITAQLSTAVSNLVNKQTPVVNPVPYSEAITGAARKSATASTLTAKSTNSPVGAESQATTATKHRALPTHPSTKNKADPKCSIVITKLEDTHRFHPKCIKTTLTALRPSCASLITQARTLNSGNLLIEAFSEAGCQELLTGWPKNCFGRNAKIQCMNNIQKETEPSKALLIAHNIPADADPTHLQEELRKHHPSVDQVTVVPARENHSTTVAKFSVPSEEADSIVQQGCFADFQHHRVTKAGRRPIRCFNCQRFGHVASVCRSQKRCARCGNEDEEHPNQCNEPLKCCNCEGEHAAYSTQCPLYIDQLSKLEQKLQ